MADSKNKIPAPGQPTGLGKYNRGPFSWLLLGLLLMTMLMTVNRWQRIERIDYSPPFRDHIRQGHVKKVVLEQTRILGTFNDAGKAARKADAPVEFEVLFSEPEKNEKLMELLEENGVTISGSTPTMWLPVLVSFISVGPSIDTPPRLTICGDSARAISW